MPYVIHYAGGEIALPEFWDAGPITHKGLMALYQLAVERDGWLDLETGTGQPGSANEGGVVYLRVGEGIPFGIEWRDG